MSSLGAIDSAQEIQPVEAKPTIIFVPGAFHTAAHFGPLSRYLEKKGYENLAVRLPSMTERAGTKEGGMAQDVASIRGLLEVLIWDEEGGDGVWGANSSSPRPSSSSKYPPAKRASGQKSVVLVMHDIGAVSGTQAAVNLTCTLRLKEGKKGGIISMVSIDGILVPEGESIESTMKALGEPALPRYAEIDGPLLRPSDNAAAILYGHLPPDQAARWTTKLEPQSLSVFSEVVQGTHWEVDVPVTFVRCMKNPGVERILEMVTAVDRANWTVETIESGGSPLISHVEKLGRLIDQAAQVE